MTKTHSALTTLYYLLRSKIVTARKLNGGSASAGAFNTSYRASMNAQMNANQRVKSAGIQSSSPLKGAYYAANAGAGNANPNYGYASANGYANATHVTNNAAQHPLLGPRPADIIPQQIAQGVLHASRPRSAALNRYSSGASRPSSGMRGVMR